MARVIKHAVTTHSGKKHSTPICTSFAAGLHGEARFKVPLLSPYVKCQMGSASELELRDAVGNGKPPLVFEVWAARTMELYYPWMRHVGTILEEFDTHSFSAAFFVWYDRKGGYRRGSKRLVENQPTLDGQPPVPKGGGRC